MRMECKYVIRRRIVAGIALALLLSLFTYATRDTCYVGQSGNALGSGSCSKMSDEVIKGGK